MSIVCFRCDGGSVVGAGHVARCLEIALACRGAGDEVLFAGRFEGVAALLLDAAGIQTRPHLEGTVADAVVVDSYEMPAAEVEALASREPVVVISDGGPAPRGALVLDYHPDAAGADLAGTDYAPVSPRLVAARRKRGFERVLVTVGGGEGGGALREAARAALGTHGLTAIEPDASPGLLAEIEQADVAVSAAGVTAYELACAGVPAALVPVARNQRRVAETFTACGLALAGDDPVALLGELADGGLRAKLAAAGPAALDGYGSFRVRDAMRARHAGRPLPPVYRYRPATAADAERQLAWRNEEQARAASWDPQEVAREEHAAWFEGVLADRDRTLLVIEAPPGPAGSVRFDAEGAEAEISVIVAAERRGEGIGPRAIRQTCELYLAAHPRVERVRAEIREDNPRSVAAFARAGFERAQPAAADGRPVFTLGRAALASGLP